MVEIGLIRPTNPQYWIATNIRRIADEFYHKCLKASYTSSKIGKTKKWSLQNIKCAELLCFVTLKITTNCLDIFIIV